MGARVPGPGLSAFGFGSIQSRLRRRLERGACTSLAPSPSASRVGWSTQKQHGFPLRVCLFAVMLLHLQEFVKINLVNFIF